MDQARLEDLVMAAAERPSGKNLDKLLTELRALPGGAGFMVDDRRPSVAKSEEA